MVVAGVVEFAEFWRLFSQLRYFQHGTSPAVGLLLFGRTARHARGLRVVGRR
jgi:hypothetical protein